MVTGGRKEQSRSPQKRLTLKVDALSHDGKGVARNNGKTVFINGALAGETVECKIEKSLSRHDYAQMLKVLEASPERQQPFCEHFGECGGCNLQMLQAKEQIRHKQEVLADQLRRFAKTEVNQWAKPLQLTAEDKSDQGYRFRARLHVEYSKGSVLLGFKKEGSKKLIDITSGCPVLVQPLQNILPELKQQLIKLAAGLRLEEVLLTYSKQQISVGLLAAKSQKKPTAKIIGQLQAWAESLQLSLFYKLVNQPLNMVRGDEFLIYQINQDLQIRFSADDFTQVNPHMNQLMVAQAMEWLEIQAGKTYLDLFCGLGNFSLAMAQAGAEVTGFEMGQDMVKRAAENARINQLHNVSFVAADLFKPLSKPWAKAKYQAVLLDPPRAGAETVCQWLAKAKPADQILYVSCNPATLARDAGILTQGGYSVSRAGVMDMFPHTAHVESMILFER